MPCPMEQEIPGISKFPGKGQLPETFCSIRFCTGISGNFGPMDRAPEFLVEWIAPQLFCSELMFCDWLKKNVGWPCRVHFTVIYLLSFAP